ncbi:hypothetical protein DL95DRAFT_415479 [Leptodontidium sp. 2 PMI_412]|nr:hypothetical protein DL95DRAFT_415479 [Leptodontidium sp. 2 PMI_412]
MGWNMRCWSVNLPTVIQLLSSIFLLKHFISETILCESTNDDPLKHGSISNASCTMPVHFCTYQLDRAHQIARFGMYTICATFVVLVIVLAAGYIPTSTLPGQARAARFTAVFWTSVALNVGTDIILIGIPFLVLSILTEKRTRIAVSIVFGLAGIVIVVAIIRAILINADGVNSKALIIVLSHVEITAGIIISAIPVISRGFTRIYLRGSSVGNSKNQVLEIRQGRQWATVGSEFGSLGVGSSCNYILNDIEPVVLDRCKKS